MVIKTVSYLLWDREINHWSVIAQKQIQAYMGTWRITEVSLHFISEMVLGILVMLWGKISLDFPSSCYIQK